jgi:hypothetical protein
MCGGGGPPDPPKKDAPPPTPPPELLLDTEGRKKADLTAGRRRARAGRSSLVTPGLNIGSAIGGAIGTALGGLGIGSHRRARK